MTQQPLWWDYVNRKLLIRHTKPKKPPQGFIMCHATGHQYKLDFLNYYLILFFIYFPPSFLPFLLSSSFSFFHSVEKLEKSKHLKRTPGRSENGKLENIAEIKHFGSDIKHTRLADTLLRKPARLWELFTRGFWFHTAPLCSQVKQHVFFTLCHLQPVNTIHIVCIG